MADWYLDLILDLDWYAANGGKVLVPAARSTRDMPGEDRVEFLLYGDGYAIRHLRVLFSAEDYDQASAVTNRNVVFWREAIAVTSVVATSHYTAAATLGANSSLHAVILAQGGESAPFIILEARAAKPVPANYAAAALSMATWPFAFRHHIHFLAKFLNPNLPADVRWLHGYRFLEWHFERGSVKLASNAQYKAFLDQHAADLDAKKPANRTRAGFLEEVRAMLAHALMADRPTEDAQQQIQSAATNTMAVLEHLVLVIMNENAPAGLTFMPKPPPEPDLRA